jgi:alpha-ribazole phosphatase CobZ
LIDVEVKFETINDMDAVVVRLPNRMRSLSSAILGGGSSFVSSVVIMQVPANYECDDPLNELERSCAELGIPDDVLGFMTAAKVRKVTSVVRERFEDSEALVVATAGLSNAVIAGEPLPMYTLADSFKAGTINIIAVVNEPLDDVGMINAIIPMTEAKTAAIRDLGADHTGTTSDAVAILCPEGSSVSYSGSATNVGIALARATRKAVLECLTKNGDGPRPTDFIMRLEEKGVTMDDMWEAALGLYVPNPDWSTDDLRVLFEERLNAMRTDVNINSIVLAAIDLDARGESGRLYGLSREGFQEDPVHLLADEMMAMALSEYISGTRGLFEYTRYDRKKPGILATLPPFLDDIVAALIGAIMSGIYTMLLEEE